MSVKEDYQSLMEERADLDKRIKEVGTKLFEIQVEGLFEKYPNLRTFSFVQYTPYFNDGDACYFSVREEPEEINDIDEWWKSDEDGPDDEEDIENQETSGLTYKEYTEIQEEISEFISSLNEGDLLEMFGDHARVVVSRQGVEVQKYNHD